MIKFTITEYNNLRHSAEVLESDSFGEKVLLRPDGTFLKLFRRKRLISSAAWYPYAQRFANNADALQKLGIPCPTVIAVYRVTDLARDVVHYQPLPGQTVRKLIASGIEPASAPVLRYRLRNFIEQLHDTGIYFRSLHLGNIVLTPGNELGLIDIADLRIYGRKLSSLERKRNWRHLARYAQDNDWLGDSYGLLNVPSGSES